MAQPQRVLISRRRWVAPEQRAEYDRAWSRLKEAAAARAAHAWRFVSTEQEELFLEFLEFAPDSDPRADASVVAALDSLSATFGLAPAAARAEEEWREAG